MKFNMAETEGKFHMAQKNYGVVQKRYLMSECLQ